MAAKPTIFPASDERLHVRRGVRYNGSVLGPTARCANHADREAMGICVRCRTLVCAECVTQVDGINHCVACLAAAAAARASAPAPTAKQARPGSGSLVLLTILLALALWGVLEATLPG